MGWREGQTTAPALSHAPRQSPNRLTRTVLAAVATPRAAHNISTMMADDSGKGGEYNAYNDPQQQQRQSQYGQAQPAAYPDQPASSAPAMAGSSFASVKFIVTFLLFVFSLIVLGTGAFFAVVIFGFAIFVGIVGFLLSSLMMLCEVMPNNMGTIPYQMPMLEMYGGLFLVVCNFAVFIGAAVNASQIAAAIGAGNNYTGNAGACSAFAFFSMILWAYVAFMGFRAVNSNRPSAPAGNPTTSV